MKPTASKLSIYATCRLAAVLPEASRSNPFAEEGTSFHSFLERIVTLQLPPERGGESLGAEAARAKALEEAGPEYRAGLERLSLATLQLDPTRIATEVAFALDVTTGEARVLGHSIGRAYEANGATANEICGSADRVALLGAIATGGFRGYLGDYKRFSANLEPIRESWQMRFLALAMSRAYHLTEVEVEHVVLADDGEPRSEVALLSAFDLDAFLEELRVLDAQMQADRERYERDGVMPPATLSDKCRYCPGAVYCPARLGVAAALMNGNGIVHLAGKREILVDAENAARLWVLKGVAEKVLEELDQALRTFAYQTPFTLPDGKIVGPVADNSREITDPRRAAEIIRDRLSPAAAEAAIELKLPTSGLEDAARTWIRDERSAGRETTLTIKSLSEELFELILNAGAGVRHSGRKIMAKKPAKSKEK